MTVTDEGGAVFVSKDGTVRARSLADGRVLWILDIGRSPTRAALSRDGTRAIVVRADTSLRLWDLPARVEKRLLDEGAYELGASPVITPDGALAISISQGDAILVWDLDTGREVFRMPGHTNEVNQMVLTSNGRRLVSASDDGSLRVWDLTAGRAVAAFSADSPLSVCDVAPDGSVIVTGDSTGRVHILRLEGDQPR
jgi:WD40 repeat protein